MKNNNHLEAGQYKNDDAKSSVDTNINLKLIIEDKPTDYANDSKNKAQWLNWNMEVKPKWIPLLEMASNYCSHYD